MDDVNKIYTMDNPMDESNGKYIIYLAINTRNNKWYVGQTRSKLKQRWKDHVKRSKKPETRFYFQNAIHKHGPAKFEVWELYRCHTQEDADMMEKFFIAITESHKSELGYNLCLGGGGVVLDEEAKKRRREKRALKPNPRIGTKHTEEAKAKMKAAAALKRPRTEEHKRNIGTALRKFNKEHPERRQEYIPKGETHYAFGKKFSDETKNKMSASHKKYRASKRQA